MATGLEIALLVVVLLTLVVAARLVQAARPFIANAIGGLLIFLLADIAVGVSVAVTPLTLLIVTLGGVPGAVLVVVLSLFGVGFAF